MRYPATEKLEVIMLVDPSHLPAERTLVWPIPRRRARGASRSAVCTKPGADGRTKPGADRPASRCNQLMSGNWQPSIEELIAEAV